MTKMQKIQNVLNFENSIFEFVSNFGFRALGFTLVWVTAVFLSLHKPSLISAASISISDAGPGTLTSADQEYQANISLLINASDGTKYYIGGVFSVQGSSNYCGKTWNTENSSWVSYTDQADLPAVTVASSSAAITIKTRLDIDDSGCQSAGTYVFKVRRYTEGGSASFDEQNAQTVVIALPTFTPTPSRTPSPAPTAKPDPTSPPVPTSKPASSPTVPQKTPTSPKTATPTPLNQRETLTPTDRNEPTVSAVADVAEHGTQSASVLGITDNSSNRVNPVIVGLIAGGGLCIGSAGYLMVRAKRRSMS